MSTPTTTAAFQDSSDAATPTPAHAGHESRARIIAATLSKLLSREGVASDAYLAPLLTQRGDRVALAFAAIASHPALLGVSEQELAKMLHKLHEDELVDLAENGQVVMPLMHPKRRTVIIRDPCGSESQYRHFLATRLPPHIELSDVREMRTENTAYSAALYVTMRTEVLARELAQWLQTQEFNGRPLRVAIKSESQYSVYQLLPTRPYRRPPRVVARRGPRARATPEEFPPLELK